MSDGRAAVGFDRLPWLDGRTAARRRARAAVAARRLLGGRRDCCSLRRRILLDGPHSGLEPAAARPSPRPRHAGPARSHGTLPQPQVAPGRAGGARRIAVPQVEPAGRPTGAGIDERHGGERRARRRAKAVRAEPASRRQFADPPGPRPSRRREALRCRCGLPRSSQGAIGPTGAHRHVRARPSGQERLAGGSRALSRHGAAARRGGPGPIDCATARSITACRWAPPRRPIPKCCASACA